MRCHDLFKRIQFLNAECCIIYYFGFRVFPIHSVCLEEFITGAERNLSCSLRATVNDFHEVLWLAKMPRGQAMLSLPVKLTTISSVGFFKIKQTIFPPGV